ncbi:CPBP family intramembrane metalloprotease [Aeromicrobium phragmitis]|uniref:CPBP family intramembrane metalloprotease n=2 Tax=Aeromicrobium phragmitis TaxID=2478914 RepID=A0A3L8PNU5_9ACTN|nr:CPBP family intramembrane metalloprotease [Aeromicrobium phragmitis]
MWLEGGSSTQLWGWELVAWAVMALGVGLVTVALAPSYDAVLWLVMVVPVAVAFRRSVPRGLLRFRSTDLLFGLVLGALLRLFSGWLERSADGSLHWPRFDTASAAWWLDAIVAPVLVAPVVEEFFFHGLLLVALYTVLRRATRRPLLAGTSAASITTAAFVLMHLATGTLGTTWASSVTVLLVGLSGAALVLTTGRVWGAVLMHIVFNVSYVGFALIGTMVATGTPGLS